MIKHINELNKLKGSQLINVVWVWTMTGRAPNIFHPGDEMFFFKNIIWINIVCPEKYRDKNDSTHGGKNR